MAYIDHATKETVLAAVDDEQVATELAAFDITAEEVETLSTNLNMLAGAAGRMLWPDEASLAELERHAMLDEAKAATSRLVAAEQQARRPVVRDSSTMILELVHVSGDPTVLAHSHESWLWGPLGPPCSGDFTELSPEQRYHVHAEAHGLVWDKRTARAFTRREVTIHKELIATAERDLEQTADAITAGYEAMAAAADNISAGTETAEAYPDGPWPVTMADWSTEGWEAAATVRSSTQVLLTSSAAAGIITVLGQVNTNEERGILVPAARARARALGQWWDIISPARPAAPSEGHDVSFWLADGNPLEFWAAAMTAAWLECGRNRRGGPIGVAEALLGR